MCGRSSGASVLRMENTDLKLLTDMLRRANVPFTVFRGEYADREKWSTVVAIPGGFGFFGEGRVIESFDGDPTKYVGYSGFAAESYFDASGQLVAVGAWE